jgi:uncharacterized protein (TIGR04222 family)
MNPFDFAGPPFLVFFICLSVAVIVAMRLVNRAIEGPRTLSQVNLEDPYAIAYLRGGQAEATRVAVVALVDRGLLKAKADQLVMGAPKAEAFARRPIEQAVLKEFKHAKAAIAILEKKPRAALDAACETYKRELQRLGALTGGATILGRLGPFAVALVLIEGTAITKILVALSRGRHNIGFLVILGIVAFLALIGALLKKRTGYGDLVLRQHRERFDGLKRRAANVAPGGATNEVALLAALWGLSVLPAENFPYIKTVFPKAANAGSDSWSSGCGGSGCGGGGGGGGGCGGGGCGGGCGGCGG